MRGFHLNGTLVTEDSFASSPWWEAIANCPRYPCNAPTGDPTSSPHPLLKTPLPHPPAHGSSMAWGSPDPASPHLPAAGDPSDASIALRPVARRVTRRLPSPRPRRPQPQQSHLTPCRLPRPPSPLSAADKNPLGWHFCFERFLPPPARPPARHLLPALRPAAPRCPGGGTPLPNPAPTAPQSGGQDPRCSSSATRAPQTGRSVTASGCGWPAPGAGGARWVPVWWVLHGVMMVAGEQWAPAGSRAAFNPILPTWPRPQEEP